MALAVRRDPRMRFAEFSACEVSAWFAPLPAEERRERPDGRPDPVAPRSAQPQPIVFNPARARGPRFDPKRRTALPRPESPNDLTHDGARDPIVVSQILAPAAATDDRGCGAASFETFRTSRITPIVDRDETRVEVRRRDGADGTIDPPDFDGLADVDALSDHISSQD